MELIKCDKTHSEKVTELYHRTIRYLEENINYPKWSEEHPSDCNIQAAIISGTQYACIDKEKILGAVVLSTDPEGFYEAGNWSRELKDGECFFVHALAVDPLFAHNGIGVFMVEQCIKTARQGGYKALRLDVVPGNIPAESLYRKMGFVFAGTKDLKRNIDDIPVFDLYELDLI